MIPPTGKAFDVEFAQTVQTVCNNFSTKQQLVNDRSEQIQDRPCELIRARPESTSTTAAIRDFVLRSVASIPAIPPISGAASSAIWPRSARPSGG